MSEQNQTPKADDNSVKNDSTQAEANDNYKEIPETRFNEVIAQKNKVLEENSSLKDQLDKFKSDQESARKKKLEDDGQLQTLLYEANTKNEKLSAVANEFTEYKANKRSSIMETITNDEDRDIADGMPLEKLEKFANRVTQTNNVGTPNQRPANSMQGTGDFGGYDYWAEFAINDPKGAEIALNKIK